MGGLNDGLSRLSGNFEIRSSVSSSYFARASESYVKIQLMAWEGSESLARNYSIKLVRHPKAVHGWAAYKQSDGVSNASGAEKV